ncbi:MAG: translocation/assembly module TamB domain-containing protein, partial [Bacteroidia bacterium]
YRLGDISLTGTFKGFVDSFKTIGTLKSALGLANANAAVKLDSVAANNKYSGHLNLVNFNLGEFLENNDFGIVSIDSDIEAKGNKIENLSAQIDAKVTSFTYKRYNYHNVKIDGKLANYFFKGELNSKDTNANIKLLGTVNFTNKIPKIDIDARLHQLNLHKLNLTKDTISIKSKVLANFEGNKVENFIGSVSTQNLFLTVNQNKYETGFTTLNGSLTPMGKSWTLESDFATASIETSIPLTQIPQSLIEHGILLVPKNIGQQTQLAPHYLNATASIHNPLILNSIIPDNLLFAQNTKAAVFIDDSEQIFDIEFSAPFFKYDNIYFDAPQTTICSNADTLFAFGKLLALNTNEFSLNGFNFNLSSDSSFVYLNHSGSINDSIVNFNLNHSIAYSQTGNTAITIDSSQFTVDTNTFKIACDTLLWQQLTDFKFDNLAFYLGNEKLLTNGTASLKNEYNVDYSLFRLSLSKVAPFLPDYFKTITGQVSGNGHINSDKGHPVIEASLYANPVSFNNLDIDAIQIESHYSAQTKVLAIYSSILNPQGKEILYVKGGLNYLTQPTIDLLFGADAIPNSFFEPLTIDVVSDLKGSATASARLSGPLESPKLNGWLALDSSFLHVDYLGTNYSLEDTFFINSEKILVNNLTLIDHRGKTAIVNGNIKHDLLKKFDLNLDLRCTDFTVFDIDENENDLYYGSFYGTGSAKFTGPMLRANIYCDLVTEKGTKFFLPIEEEQGYSQESFIRFVNSENALTEYEVNDQDFSLDLNVTLNPKAETQLIFDKKLGDIIKASGDGKLNMKLTPAGEFQMFGDYIIDQGNYLFTAFDLINKRFEIEKGGKISWVGDPYDALIDIKANYNLKANAYSLASNLPQYDAAQLEQYKTPVPVVAYAQLNGSLLKPEINLDFEFIDEGGVDVASLQRELDNMNFSDEELTKQVVSLLVLNRFMPMYNSAPVNTDIFSSSVNAGLGDLISNQLTYWLSAISDDLQVNVNYRRYTSDGIELSEGELELALSTTFFNDRVGVDFAYELQNGYSPNKEISYKVNPDGSIKVLVFQRQTQNPV